MSLPQKQVDLIKKTAHQLFVLLGVSAPDFTLDESQQPPYLTLRLPEQEAAAFIGPRAETLTSLQLVLNLLLYHQTGTWLNLIVDVNDYRQRRRQSLERIAFNTAQKVKFSGQPVTLPYLSPSERRVIHLALADHPDVTTESVGTGPNRRLVIKPRREKKLA